MSILSDFNRWLAECCHVSSRGSVLTPGDLVHCGLHEYRCRRPMPNGLPVDRRTPNEVPAWRARIEKARRDIARSGADSLRDEIVERLTDDDVFHALERVKRWAKVR